MAALAGPEAAAGASATTASRHEIVARVVIRRSVGRRAVVADCARSVMRPRFVRARPRREPYRARIERSPVLATDTCPRVLTKKWLAKPVNYRY